MRMVLWITLTWQSLVGAAASNVAEKPAANTVAANAGTCGPDDSAELVLQAHGVWVLLALYRHRTNRPGPTMVSAYPGFTSTKSTRIVA